MLNSALTGLVLAGGRGHRMGGVDKGFVLLDGRPLIAYALDVARAMATDVLVSANRNIEDYAALGCRVVVDEDPDFKGPLSGILAGMKSARTPWMMVLPCDMPYLSTEMLKKLLPADQKDESISLVIGHDGQRLQPLLMLVRTNLTSSLESYLGEGERRVEGWVSCHPHRVVDLSLWTDQLRNLNRPEDL
jgi:molybdopterin-guanine dinucleotide biosynthesis protein A